MRFVIYTVYIYISIVNKSFLPEETSNYAHAVLSAVAVVKDAIDGARMYALTAKTVLRSGYNGFDLRMTELRLQFLLSRSVR